MTKLHPSGSLLVYSTYLGGQDSEYIGDQAMAIATDAAGNAYVTGTTDSRAFPTTAQAFQRVHGGYYDAFVAKIVDTTPPPPALP